ncbi:MAG: hypothetical protein V1660_02740 [archaeon]
MKRQIALLGFMFLIGIILFSSNVSAYSQCCVINNSKCTFWDMGDSSEWTQAKDFCEKLPIADSYFHTFYYSNSCSSISSSLPNCKDGFIVCGDNQCSFPETCSSCSKDCGACEGENQCTPRWKCTDWGNCTKEGKQTRTCTNSRFTCNREKPEESQSCTYVAPKPVEQPVVNTTVQTEEPEIINESPVTQNDTQEINSNSGITGNVVKTTGGVEKNVAIVAAIGVIMAAVIFFVLRFSKK